MIKKRIRLTIRILVHNVLNATNVTASLFCESSFLVTGRITTKNTFGLPSVYGITSFRSFFAFYNSTDLTIQLLMLI